MSAAAKPSVELVPQPSPPSPTLFRTENPAEVVARAGETANALATVVKKQKLTVKIQGREHVLVEGWTLLGAMLGVFPVCAWSKKLENGWEARVEARTKDGAVIGAAEAMCVRAEKTWSKRDDFALRSMAQTRATSKALRQPLGFVMTMAGFSATPAEEMDAVVEDAKFTAVDDVPFGEEPSSDAQRRNVFRLITKLDKEGIVSKDESMEAIGKLYGTETIAELYKHQASELISRLKTKAGEDE